MSRGRCTYDVLRFTPLTETTILDGKPVVITQLGDCTVLIARLPELAGSVLIAEIVHHVLMAWDLYDPDTDTFASWDEFRLAASRLPIPCLPAHFIRAFSLLRLQVLKLRLGDYALRLARDISSPRLIFSVHIANG